MTLNSTEQEQFIASYRAKRAIDFENRKKPSSSSSKFSLEEKELMKKLGINTKSAKLIGGSNE